MDLAIGIIFLVLGALTILLLIVLIGEGVLAFNQDNSLGIPIGIFLIILFCGIGFAYTIPSAQSYDYVERCITSFHPEANEFVIGMSQGKHYYVLDASDSSLVEKDIKSSIILRDEEENPYIQKVSKYGSKDVTYYFHVPENVTIFIM